MSNSKCAACGASNLGLPKACPECHASPEWLDLFQASRVAGEQCAELQTHGLLSEFDRHRVNELLSSMRLGWTEQLRQGAQPPTNTGLKPPSHCRTCGRPSGATQKFCPTCGDPTGMHADRLRHLDFVSNLFANPEAIGMTSDNARVCVEALGSQIETSQAMLKEQFAEETTTRRASKHRNIAEILLDPQSIRWLLASGGVLLAVGLVIFLSSLGVFRNAMVVASAMGLGTLATLGGGIAIIRLTRHSLAGRSTALLGCLVMPLNLWFYNANHLVTLDGHLWIAAMVCCVLYGVAAVVLEDPMFVYVLFGGIAMTGMLVLGDLHRLVEISAPATLLVTLGLISLHAERAFADDDGPFSRKRFGLACFRSAHALMGLGLVMVLGSQLVAWAPRIGLNWIGVPPFANNQYLALALVLVGGYGHLYSSLVVRRGAVHEYSALICLLWAELLGIQIGQVTNHFPVLLSVLALTSLAMNIAASLLSRSSKKPQTALSGALPLLGVGLMALQLGMGLIPQFRAVFPGLIGFSHLSVTWNYVGALALTAVSSRIAVYLNARRGERLTVVYLVATAAATFIGATGALTLIGLNAWPARTTVLMAIPMIYLLASRFHKDGPVKQALPNIAGAAAVVLFLSSLIINSSQWLHPQVGQAADVWSAAFCLEAAILFAVASTMNLNKYSIYFAAVMLCGMIYQSFGYWSLPLQSYDIAIAAAGVAALIAHRLVYAEIRIADPRAKALFVGANGLISLPMAGVMLMSLSQLAIQRIDSSMLWTLGILSLLSLISAGLVSGGSIRRWYLSLTIGQVVVSLLTLAEHSTLTLPRKVESFSVMAGLGLLVAGYGFWYREQDGKGEGAGICLLIGALMAGVPPAVFAVINRFGFDVSFIDELTLVTIAVLMFLTGMMARVRATTLIGGGLLICHLITLWCSRE